MSKRSDNFTVVAPPENPLPEIVIGHDLAPMVESAVEAIAWHDEVYQRGGDLVHVVTPPPLAPGLPSLPVLRSLPAPLLRVFLSSTVRWLKRTAKGHKQSGPPDNIVQAVHQRGRWEGVRPIVGVITSPTLRPDGSVLQTEGYDKATSLLYQPSMKFADVEGRPTMADAQNAAAAIMDLVCDFPFATDADRSAWLASVLTLVGRHAISGPCPLFAITANTPGSGKSLLADTAAMLAHGGACARTTISNVDEEMRKQITSVLSEGAAAALLDNVKSGGKFGGPAFDALLTSTTWKDRVLGRTQVITYPARTVWFSTGNNIRFVGDLARRTLRIRIESPLEKPEDRTGFKYGAEAELLRHVEKQRRFLVAQALIILRAHALEGHPMCGPTWGSFDSWVRVACAPIRWMKLADPLGARATETEGANEDSIFAGALIAYLTDRDRPMTSREIVGDLYPHERYSGDEGPDLFASYTGAREAIELSTGAKGTPTAMQIGHLLKRLEGRVVEGRALASNHDNHLKVQRWSVRSVSA